MKYYTDYPFVELGDKPGQQAPIREIEVHRYDGDKYCDVTVDGVASNIKRGCIYTKPGRCSEVPEVSHEEAMKLWYSEVEH